MMRPRIVFWIGVVVAVFVLPGARSMAFVPQTEQQVQVLLDQLTCEWFGQTPVAYQYKVAGAMRYASTGLGEFPWTVRMAYDSFESGDMKGKNLTGILGYHARRGAYEEALDELAWGFKSIEEWWCCSDYDFVLYEGVAPYLSYRHGDFSVGGYGLLGYTFSDEPLVSEELFYGIGAAGAYRWKVADAWSIVPRLSAQYYDSGQSGWEESLSLTASAGVKFDVTEKVTLGASLDYTAETADVIDDNWYSFGVDMSGRLSDYLEVSAGIRTTQGYDGPLGAEFDNYTLSAGLRLSF